MNCDKRSATPHNTNIGEGQHAWTNEKTGTQHRAVTAIETCNSARGGHVSHAEWLPSNTQNEFVHRETRNLICRNNQAVKSQEVQDQYNKAVDLQSELDAAQDEFNSVKARQDGLEQQLKETKSAASSSGALHKLRILKNTQEESSSCRQVKKTKKAKQKGGGKKWWRRQQLELEHNDDNLELPLLSDLYKEMSNGNEHSVSEGQAELPELVDVVMDYNCNDNSNEDKNEGSED
ncbi:hypothetical protein E1B28_011845 [Marasmius oreades]|uniref:Uncharacterized protein n=1 Tax=Marasmius oreades TaxID=181124 RepID=A0A9P7RVL8_9AGAR|nr:uncharacterized protein E1B28_011845 [Marasmius oreades]KAG7090247.1 hypothetical protein E1B28_011845 [Marasmius oreades]